LGVDVFSRALYVELLLENLRYCPVRAGLVEKEEEYLWSSCGTVYGVRKGLLELAEF
jgi:putative transposase